MAARHTEQRASNFDIYLPLWLARYNRTIFVAMFVAGGSFVLAGWWTSSVRSGGVGGNAADLGTLQARELRTPSSAA